MAVVTGGESKLNRGDFDLRPKNCLYRKIAVVLETSQ